MDTPPASDILSIPPDLLAQIEAEAEAEHRPTGDVLRDVIARGLSEQRRQAQAGQEHELVHELDMLDHIDDPPMTDQYRRAIREKIAQGVRSLREGRVTDGAAFMARLDAELAELERQGQE